MALSPGQPKQRTAGPCCTLWSAENCLAELGFLLDWMRHSQCFMDPQVARTRLIFSPSQYVSGKYPLNETASIYNSFLSFKLRILLFPHHLVEWGWEAILNLAFVLILAMSLCSLWKISLMAWGGEAAFSFPFERIKRVLESWLRFLVKIFIRYAIKNNSAAI